MNWNEAHKRSGNLTADQELKNKSDYNISNLSPQIVDLEDMLFNCNK
jgi:hypothetical protein